MLHNAFGPTVLYIKGLTECAGTALPLYLCIWENVMGPCHESHHPFCPGPSLGSYRERHIHMDSLTYSTTFFQTFIAARVEDDARVSTHIYDCPHSFCLSD
jgi:hypothetical protein